MSLTESGNREPSRFKQIYTWLNMGYFEYTSPLTVDCKSVHYRSVSTLGTYHLLREGGDRHVRQILPAIFGDPPYLKGP